MSKPLNQMDCTELFRMLPQFLDGELAGQEQVAVNQHLASCPACREELARLKTDMEFLARTGVPELPPHIATRVMAEVRSRQTLRRRFGLGRVLGSAAAVLLVCASIGIGAVLGSGLGRSRTSATTSSEEVTLSTNEPTFADVFTSVVVGQ